MRSRTYHLDHPLGFLRPSMHQILWTIGLVLIFLPFVLYDTGIRCITAPCPSSLVTSLVGLLIFHSPEQAIGISWPVLLLGTIATYIIVSLIAAVRHSTKH